MLTHVIPANLTQLFKMELTGTSENRILSCETYITLLSIGSSITILQPCLI